MAGSNLHDSGLNRTDFSIDDAAAQARSRGLLVSEVVIPGPSKELFAEYV